MLLLVTDIEIQMGEIGELLYFIERNPIYLIIFILLAIWATMAVGGGGEKK